MEVIQSVTPNDIRRCPSICMEISEGGMSAMVTDLLNAGDEVKLSFDVKPGRKSLSKLLCGITITSARALSFVGLSDETRAEIRILCASLRSYEGGWY